MLYEALARPVLFRLGGGDPEVAHDTTLRALSLLARQRRLAALARRFGGARAEPRTVFGVRFPGPVGLAGGLDKNGVALPAWPALGFGFVEVGTVTWHPQAGNAQPRLFRLRASEAVINRMGFNNRGAAVLAERLAAWGPQPVPVGISLGKSKVTPLDEAVEDYLSSLRALHPYGDYFAINVSSPNTPGLRSLQDRGHLGELLGALAAEARSLAEARSPGEAPTPLLVKIAPDLTEPAIGEVLEVCAEHGIAGVIATNTTLSRNGLAPEDQHRAIESGGLSGRPLSDRALAVVRFIARESRLPIIGVGGIVTPDDADRMFDAGASLVQVYTGLLYRGPALVRGINRRHRGSVAQVRQLEEETR